MWNTKPLGGYYYTEHKTSQFPEPLPQPWLLLSGEEDHKLPEGTCNTPETFKNH